MWLLRRASHMFRVGRPDSRFTLGIAVPATIVLAVAASTLVFALNEIAGEVNRTALSLTRQTVGAAVQSTLRLMANTHSDYAVWDDAARKLYGNIDWQFAHDSIATSTEDGVLFDTVYLLNTDGTAIFGFRNGVETAAAPAEAVGPSLIGLLRAARQPASLHAQTALVSGMWGPMVMAIGPVIPFSKDIPVPEHKRFLIIAKSLDQNAVGQLAQDYLIDGLTLVAPSAAVGQTTVPLTDADGSTIAAFTWNAPTPGSAALARLKPWVIGMLAALALTMLGLVAIAAHGFGKLRRGEMLARHAATHDPLSGLPNRTALVVHLTLALAERHRSGNLALACVELDGLQEINDTYGHEVGDELLREVAQGFRAIAGKCYLVRLGGDEFAVLIDKPDATDHANELGERLIRFFTKPFDVGGRIISVSGCVGIALIDHAGISAEEALRRGDVALYQARQEGRNRVCLFDDSLDAARRARIEIAGDLRRALATEGLTLFYQPIFSAHDGRIVSAEALLRWPRDDGNAPISPAEFIPIAEESGLIDELGMWTLRRACRDAAAWPGLKVSVNVSPAQLPNPNFAKAVAAVLDEAGLPANRLEIEVTETYLVTHPDQARRAIDAIRALGVTVALDDFGVGYSSIGYLRSFAFDKLKLDRSLIAGLHRDPHAQKLVQATVALADALDLKVTAEGVETAEEATLLRIAGCDAFQGFYFARPAPAAALTALVAAEASMDKPGRPLQRA